MAIDGIYSIAFRGTADWGMGLLMLRKGAVVGADVAGVTYDGEYEDLGESVDFVLKLRVPPGVTLVQGTKPQPKPYVFEIRTNIQKRIIGTSSPHLLQTDFGPVNVTFTKLRELVD